MMAMKVCITALILVVVFGVQGLVAKDKDSIAARLPLFIMWTCFGVAAGAGIAWTWSY